MLTLLLGIARGAESAHPLGNEWIDYGRTYVKVRVSSAGVYRIYVDTLWRALGYTLSLNGRDFQLWHMGRQVPLFVGNDQGEKSGALSTGDYIEFYAQPFDGQVDHSLYEDTSWMLNPRISIYDDSGTYFLTWVPTLLDTNARIRLRPTDLTNPPSPEPYAWDEAMVFSYDNYFYGKPVLEGAGYPFYSSVFGQGEGRHLVYLQASGGNFQEVSYSLATQGAYAGGGVLARVEVRAVGASYGTNNLSVFVGGGAAPVVSASLSYYTVRVIAGAFDASLLADPSTIVKLRVNNPAPDNLTHSAAIGYVRIEYPVQLQIPLWSRDIWLEPATGRRYLRFSSGGNYGTFWLIDLTDRKKYQGVYQAGPPPYYDFVLEPPVLSTTRRHLVVYHGTLGVIRLNSNQLHPVTFTNYASRAYNYIIITTQQAISDPSGIIQQYASYRASAQGGGYSVLVVSAEELYDQFAYGAYKHPTAIRNFIRYMRRTYGSAARDMLVFIIGVASNNPHIPSYRLNTWVPAWGFPPCDQPLAGDPDSPLTWIPQAGISRLPAHNLQQVADYLNKVMEHESHQRQYAIGSDFSMWQKNVIHLGGGTDAGERAMIQNFLEAIEDIIEAPLWGASVTPFYKQSADPIEIAISEKFDSLIRVGTVLLTFMGHSSPNNFDIQIDEPENYENEGKYPVVLSNGCYVGEIYTQEMTLARRFVLTPRRGAIGFFAGTYLTFGWIDYLISRAFYELLAEGAIKEPVAQVWQKAYASKLRSYAQSNEAMMQHLTSFAISGDPAIRLFLMEKPELVLSEGYAQISPSTASLADDSVKLTFRVFNVGLSVADTTLLRVVHRLPNGIELTQEFTIQVPLNSDSFSLNLPTGGLTALGEHVVTVTIDPNDNVDEYEEVLNNTIALSFYVTSLELFPVYPYNHQLLDTAPITLHAFTGDIFAPPEDYVFEIDTTADFNSPLYRTHTLLSAYGLLSWTPDIPWISGTTYFWRVKRITDTLWKTMSFTYRENGRHGWHQQHRHQLAQNTSYLLSVNPTTGTMSFTQGYISFTAFNYNYWFNTSIGGGIPSSSCYVPKLHVQTYQAIGGCWARWSHAYPTPQPYDSYGPTFEEGGIHFLFIDTATGEFFVDDPADNQTSIHPYYLFLRIGAITGNTAPGQILFDVHVYPGDNNGDGIRDIDTPFSHLRQERFARFLDSLPRRYIMVAFGVSSPWGPRPSVWSDSLKNTLRRLGFSAVDSLKDLMAWVFIGRMADTTFRVWAYTRDTYDIVSIDTFMLVSWKYGFIESEWIGPSAYWDSIIWEAGAADAPTEEAYIEVWGMDREGNITLLIPHLLGDTSLSWLHAKDYPYIKLRYYTKDTARGTPRQLYHWTVNYLPVPELVYDPQRYYVFNADTLHMGQQGRVELRAVNVTHFDMDSVLVEWVLNPASATPVRVLSRTRPLRAGESDTFRYLINTSTLSGSNFLTLTANPYLKNALRNDQPEKYTFNNSARWRFYVVPDRYNPLLDVTFDGRHIFDGEYVSPTPHIVISLRDENPYMPLNDTSLLNVFIEYPDNTLRRVAFSDPSVRFYPAKEGTRSNEARIEFMPTFTQSGIYRLIVQGEDKAGNQAGKYNYSISFRVELKSMITHVVPYPNPFTTSTRFVFVLTGSQVPDQLTIQIATLSGRIVRQITLEELGPIHIGTNITEFEWDGTDQYGQPLGNGVYLYRVIARINGQDIEHLATPADQYFKSGWGRLYIAR